MICTMTLFGQDHLLDKKGSSYFYKGKEYKWKELGILYIKHEKAFNIYDDGNRALNTSKNLAIGGVVSMAAGFAIFSFWPNIYGAVYGSIAIMSGVLIESVAFIYLVKGKVKISKARTEFNFEMMKRHGYESSVSFGVGVTRNGFGLLAQF